MKKSISILFSLLLPFLLVGCEKNISTSEMSIPVAEGSVLKSETKEVIKEDEDETIITLLMNATVCNNDTVKIKNNIITITEAGDYVFSGKLTNGQIVVDAKEAEVKIVLNNVELTNTAGSALYVQKAKEVTIELAENSTNFLTDGTNYENEALNAVVYSTADLKIKGKSKSELTITGLYKDGIASNDDLKIKNAVIHISAVDDGLRGKDSVTIDGATLDITADGDGIKSDNSEDEERGIITIEESDIKISAGDDAIHGVQVVEILSGNIEILKSYEGIEGKKITINDGIVTLVSIDDGLNVTEKQESSEEEDGKMFDRGDNSVLEGGMLTINGGLITMNTGGDGFDSNGNAIMTGGTLIVNGPTNDRNGPLDVNGNFEVTGGTIIAVGSSGMAETPDETSSQNSIQVNFEQTQDAGTVVSLTNENRKEIFSFTPEKMFQSVTYSSDELKKGETYTFLLNGKTITTLTLDSSITTYGTGNKMNGRDQMGGDREMKMPPDMEFPDDWDSMTEEERHEYMEANRPEGMEFSR